MKKNTVINRERVFINVKNFFNMGVIHHRTRGRMLYIDVLNRSILEINF